MTNSCPPAQPPSNSEATIQSIDRAVQILRCFESSASLSLAELCVRVNLHKSTVYGITNTLRINGLLSKDEESGRYRLGPGLYTLAASADQDIRSLAVPHIREICRVTGETVELVIPDDTHITYIEMQESEQWLRIGSAVGQRLPMYCNAAGKAILAAMSPEEASAVLDRSQLVAFTPSTHVSKDSLMREMEESRLRGYAVNRGELAHGLLAMAAVITNRRGTPVGAISCSVPTVRCDEDRIEEIGLLLKRHADEISVCLIK